MGLLSLAFYNISFNAASGEKKTKLQVFHALYFLISL